MKRLTQEQKDEILYRAVIGVVEGIKLCLWVLAIGTMLYVFQNVAP
jgi:hypothetical protein